MMLQILASDRIFKLLVVAEPILGDQGCELHLSSKAEPRCAETANLNSDFLYLILRALLNHRSVKLTPIPLDPPVETRRAQRRGRPPRKRDTLAFGDGSLGCKIWWEFGMQGLKLKL